MIHENQVFENRTFSTANGTIEFRKCVLINCTFEGDKDKIYPIKTVLINCKGFDYRQISHPVFGLMTVMGNNLFVENRKEDKFDLQEELELFYGPKYREYDSINDFLLI